jgi:hypothetical protein
MPSTRISAGPTKQPSFGAGTLQQATLGACGLDIGGDVGLGLGVDHRPDVGAQVPGIAECQRIHRAEEHLGRSRRYPPAHRAAQRRAALARRLEGRGDDVAHRLFGQRGGIDDHGVEPAGLGDQRASGAQIRGHARCDAPRRLGGAGEGRRRRCAGPRSGPRRPSGRRRAEVAARGHAGLVQSSAARAAMSGVCSAGLASTALPAASAAAIWPVKIASGKFQGLMQTKTPRADALSSASCARPRRRSSAGNRRPRAVRPRRRAGLAGLARERWRRTRPCGFLVEVGGRRRTSARSAPGRPRGAARRSARRHRPRGLVHLPDRVVRVGGVDDGFLPAPRRRPGSGRARQRVSAKGCARPRSSGPARSPALPGRSPWSSRAPAEQVRWQADVGVRDAVAQAHPLERVGGDLSRRDVLVDDLVDEGELAPFSSRRRTR